MKMFPKLAVRGAGERDEMCCTSSLPSQHDKAYVLYLNLSDYSKNFHQLKHLYFCDGIKT